MSSGPGDADRTAEQDGAILEADLLALRRRLCRADATSADRVAYERAFAARPVAPPEPGPEAAPPAVEAREDDSLDGGVARAAPREPGLLRPALLGAAAVVLVALGAAIGSVASAGRPVAQPSVAASAQLSDAVQPQRLPRPIAAAAVEMPAEERKQAAAALAERFATDDDSVLSDALGPEDSSPGSSAAWMGRKACSESSGTFRASSTGRPSIVSGETSFDLPAGAHLRIAITTTRAAGWSWIISGTRGDPPSTAPISIGAGSAAAGTSQYAEFDARTDIHVTGIRVYTADRTPFAWRLDSCVTG